MPRMAIKGQVLADFVAEFTESDTKQEDAMMTIMTIGLRNVLFGKSIQMGRQIEREPGLELC